MKKLLLFLLLLPLWGITQTVDLLRPCFIVNDTLYCYGDTLYGFSDSAGFIERVYWVDESKLTMTPNGSINAPFATIQDAIDAAPSNSVIYVAPGTYNEHLEITEDSITIKSIGGAEVTFIELVITGATGIDLEDNTTIDGFTLTGDAGGALIELETNESNVKILNNIIDITGSATFGVSVGAAGSNDLLIKGNTFFGATDDGCVWLQKSNIRPEVSYNRFFGQDSTGSYAIQTAGSDFGRYIGNYIENFASGVFLHTVTSGSPGTTNELIADNIIRKCGHGIRLGHSTQTVDMDSINVFDNKLYQNSFGINIINDAQVLSGTFFIVGNEMTLNTVNLRNNGTAAAYSANIINGGATFSGALISNTIELSTGTSANEISTDGTLAGDSDDAIPTEHAVKTYIDAADDLLRDTADNHNDRLNNLLDTAIVHNDRLNNLLDTNIVHNDRLNNLLDTAISHNARINLKVNTADSNKTSAGNYTTTLYVNNLDAAQDLDFQGDAGTSQVLINSQTFTIAGTTAEIETSASGQTLTIGLPDSIDVDIYTESGINVVNYSELQNSLVGAYYHFMVDDYIEVADNDNIDFGTANFALAIRFRPNNVSGTEYLLNKEAGGVGYGIYKVDDDIYIRFDDNNVDASAIILTAKIEAGKWYTLVISFDRSGNATALLNGSESGTVDISGANLTLSSAGAFRLASTTAGADFFDGDIAFVLPFTHTLTTAKMIEISTWSSDNPPVWFSNVGASQTELHTDANAISDPNGNEADAITGWTSNGLTGTGTNVFESQAGIKTTGGFAFYSDANNTPTDAARFTKRIIDDWDLINDKTYRVTFDIRHIGSGGIWRVQIGSTSSGGVQESIINIGNTEITFQSISYIWTQTVDHINLVFKEQSETDNGGVYVDNLNCTQIGIVGNWNGSGIGHNTWLDASGNDLFGTVSGAIWTNIPNNATQKVRQDNLTGDTQILSSSNIVPNGWKLVSIIGTETAGNTAILDCGTSASGTQIFTEQTFTASTNNPFEVNYYNFSGSDQAVYVHDDSGGSDWNSAELNFVFYLIKIK